MKKRRPLISISLLALLGILTYQYFSPSIKYSYEEGEEGGEQKELSIKAAFEDNFERTKDWTLGYPPREALIQALDQTKRMQQEYYNAVSRDGIENPRWRERGPNNIGGRTRAILIDENDPSRNTIWAGGVAGGLWKTNDINADPPQWEIVSDYLEYMAVGALAQDLDNPQIIYMGTGEGYPNADAVDGFGIYKSTDGGENWELLPSTLNNTFATVQDLFVQPGNGYVYAATYNGLQRSTDGGLNWEKVLGLTVGFANEDFYDIDYTFSDGYLYASNRNAAFKSPNGDPGSWDNMSGSTSGFPSSLDRLEFTVCQNDPNIMYIIGSDNGGATNVYTSVNGGDNWVSRALPQNGNGTEFTNGQAWYDLDIAVDPFDCNHVIAGGVTIQRSRNAGLSFERFATNMHVDQHYVLFDTEIQDRVYFGNDGGIYKSDSGSASQVQNKNQGYNVTQFYAGAIHPAPFSNYLLGGTQDNNTLALNSTGITSGRSVWGGDGFLCFIDENEPDIQIVSSQFGRWGVSKDGGRSFSEGANTQSRFLTPAAYDSESNILYSQSGVTDLHRWNVDNNQLNEVDFTNVDASATIISTIAVDPNTPNRVYVGTFSGTVLRIDDANTGNFLTPTMLASVAGTVSSVDIEDGDPDHLLVTTSSFGSAQKVYESTDGGQSWIGCTGQLPNMPVRWGIFNPNDSRQAMIATEAGVWTTQNLSAGQTEWIPPMPGRGIPLVRTDMLRLRRSDKIVLAATHARGLFTTDVFADPTPILSVDQVHYTESPLRFIGEQSLNADSYLWDFGDGASDTLENATHSYSNIGEYPISLTINGDLTESANVKVLTDHSLPYVEGESDYSGDFERFPEQYGVYTISGSSFERGNSTIPGKNGTNSGSNAFVIGLEEEFYQPNSHSMLYLPVFDFSENTIYEFSFWAKYQLQNGLDGFLVEYSTDRGQNWEVLGTKKAGWYNFIDDNLDNAAFPANTPYFSNNRNSFTQFKLNISSLAGQKEVAFRFVFKSEGGGNHRGLAIDDVSITKFEGLPETTLTNFVGEFSGPTEITLNWNTLPEFHCKTFDLERSFNGRDFEFVETFDATGKTTTELQSYSTEVLGQRDLNFFRLKVTNESVAQEYFLEFFSPTIVVRKNLEGAEIVKLFPNPFRGGIELTFSDFLDETITYELYDEIGRLVLKGKQDVTDVYTKLDFGDLPFATYMLSIQIGDAEAETYKLLGGG